MSSLKALINNNTTNKNKGWHAKKLLSYLGPTNSSCGYNTVHQAFDESTPDVLFGKNTRLYRMRIKVQTLLYNSKCGGHGSVLHHFPSQ